MKSSSSSGRAVLSAQLQSCRAHRLAICALALSFGCMAFAQVEPNLYSGLVWRNIGPFRGGRVAAVSGAIGKPGVFYMGMPGGGVWRTENAGTTWQPITDGKITTCSSVGAIEVAPSDPNVIYVGMGDMITGGAINEGDGVYKSTDTGKTWQHMGLDATKQIPSILVDPHDPNLVMVAAQGDIHQKSADRGLYRSTDGGKTWTKTLFIDDETGIQKIAWAHDNPKVMLATTVRHYRAPGGGFRGGGPGGGRGQQGDSGTHLYKSIDEGVTWTEIKGGNLPALSGRTCVAIADGTNSQRMFLVENSGLYRSDDGGSTWRQMDAKDRRVANGQGGYNCGVYVNPKDPDTIYVINTCSYVSRDGGETFTGFKGAPGGDDPQQMWLDPSDGDRLFFGTDQGATISLDGGKTWSSWYNQPTAQVYHISTDTRFPYWVYATQQDSGSIGTASRGDLGEITPLDWQPTPGYEFGSIVSDPTNPNIIYAGGPGGGIVKITYPTGQWLNVSPSLNNKLGLRKVGNQPLAFSPTNPHELLAGFQCLMASTDGGMHWKALSPDLGYPKGVKPPKPEEEQAALLEDQERMNEAEGFDDDAEPVDQFGPNRGGAIESFSASSVNANVIWAGTNNGLVKLTKDGGKTWDDVSIPKLPNAAQADITAIDASHQDPATAYLAIDRHNEGDYKPYLYRTHDYGKTWTEIVNGLPGDLASGSFARVIRADTEKSGLLFAGTESSMYVSFDDGDHWQPLTLNLPITSYRDATIHGNDLVVGTYGRGFWILDDISPLRQISASIASDSAHLFKPGDAVRVRRNTGQDTPFPPEVPHADNPPLGAVIYYYLKSKPAGEISLVVSDSKGNAIRHMSSAPIPALDEAAPPIPNYWIGALEPMPTEVGLNRINWDMRYDAPPAASHSYEINANPGQTYPSPEGPLVLPGVYTVSLSVDGKTYKQTVTVEMDPRTPATMADLQAEHQVQMRLYESAKEAWDGYQQVGAMKDKVASILQGKPSDELAVAAKAFDEKLGSLQGEMGFRGRFGGFRRGGPRPAPSFLMVNGSLVRQLESLDSGDMRPSEAIAATCDASANELKTVLAAWKNLNDKDLAAFNAVLAKYNEKPIPAAAALAMPVSNGR